MRGSTRDASGSRRRSRVFTALGSASVVSYVTTETREGAATAVSGKLQCGDVGGQPAGAKGDGWWVRVRRCSVGAYNKYKQDTPTMWRGPTVAPLCVRCLAA